MAISGRQWGLFAAGLLLGGAGVALLLGGDEGVEPKSAPAKPPATSVLGAPAVAPASSAAPVASADHLASCDGEPLLRATGRSDGQLPLPGETAGKSIDVAEKSIVAGKEVAASGRARDAEVAFLVACRIAAQAQRPQTLAEAKYHLARHYAQVADEPAGESLREKLRARALVLYTAAHALFAQQLGVGHEKTRFAASGLQALKTETVDVVRAPPLREQAVAKPRPKPEERAAEETLSAKAAPARPARRSAPSFDCGKARSAAERAICADEELAQADRALGRLHARAKARAADAGEFQRRSDEAWRWRESNCGADRECLREWYRERREALEEESEEESDEG